MAEFSGVGKKKVASHVALFVFNIVALVLATKVNQFNEFFYVADLFPLAVSIVTLIVLFFMLVLEFATARSPLGTPLIEAGILGTLSIVWLASNAFSTSRWLGVPTQCANISSVLFPREHGWCKDVQALKAFAWMTWVLCFAITLWTTTYSFLQYKRGNRQIFKTHLSYYSTSNSPVVGADWFFNNGTYANNAVDDDPIYGRAGRTSAFTFEKNPFESQVPSPVMQQKKTGGMGGGMGMAGGAGMAGRGVPHNTSAALW